LMLAISIDLDFIAWYFIYIIGELRL